jgi:undecaprenyl-diphosphatase
MDNPAPPIACPTPTERRLRRSAIVFSLISATLAGGFFALSRAVVAGRTANIDRETVLAMREPDNLDDPIGPRWFEESCRDMTALGGATVIPLIATTAILFFWLAGMRRAAIYVTVAVIGAALLSTGLKRAFERPRPDLVPHRSSVYTSSFPSGHSMLAASVYLTLGLLASRFVPRRRLKALFLTVAVLVTGAVGASRVYLGVHWPTDVLAGWAVGASWALLCWCVAAWLQDRGAIEQDIYHPEGDNRAA